jgi:hypothetical protein
MMPQIALKSGTFITKALKNQGSNKYLRYQNQPTWCQSMTRGNACGFELKLVALGMIESNPKAAYAKCCLKSL